MKQFTFSDMNRASGEILEAALVEPVTLTKRGKDKLVIMTVDQYSRLIGRSHTQAYNLMNAPHDVHQELMTGLDDILGSDNA
ncbi:type II toxin-antitoxin system Phd/YefM family antitoxin [Rhizobium tubonense]|uniref:Antitoxin n=1 Tax=Rhizobium tubonense TaxID=484088 RepID=A0A2W4F673_9HYPH|nr:type II toxin-antitoxin system Phd/YefM family antitoxin [Rhizobium tubonense]PZM16480.1 prevent-host-death protein [Rhizobium tubonense]